MKYMLMMNTPKGGPYQITQWPEQDIKAHIAFMVDFAKKLGAAGELVGAEGLAGLRHLVRTRYAAVPTPLDENPQVHIAVFHRAGGVVLHAQCFEITP